MQISFKKKRIEGKTQQKCVESFSFEHYCVSHFDYY